MYCVSLGRGLSELLYQKTQFYASVINNTDITFTDEEMTLLNKGPKYNLSCKNPTTPVIRGLVKFHKEDFPIRPIVNWKNAPAYKLARSLVEKIQTHIPLLYAFNIKNTTQLINDLKDIPFEQSLRLASFDISNMYMNIPTGELLMIIKSACESNTVKDGLKHNIIKLVKVITDRNYFQFLGQTYIQHEGLAMGAPTSCILSELYLQN